MVNYCAVTGCGRNCQNSKHLNFYSLPRDKQRLKAWLKAIGRLDILESAASKRGRHPNHRVCSRHFAPSSIKNKHLCDDAIPTLCLSGSWSEDDNNEQDDKEHIDVACNSCESKVQGVRYKCIVCDDYDLCVKCERFGAHPEHYMLRIPQPTKFRVTDNLVRELQKILASEQTDTNLVKHYSSSDDDLPITEYVNNYDNSSLTKDIKDKIKNEVTRVLSLNNCNTEAKKTGKRKAVSSKKSRDAKKCKESKSSNKIPPEVVFAEVIDNGGIREIDIKEEIQTLPTIEGVGDQQVLPIKISDELSEFILDANQYS